MKKYIYLLSLFVSGSVSGFCASPGAEVDNFDAGDNFTKQGLYFIMRGEPIRYTYDVVLPKTEKPSVAEENSLEAQIKKQAAVNNYKNIIEKNIQAWPLQTAQFIRKSGRAEEFADVLPLFEGVKTERVYSRAEASIAFVFSDMKYIAAQVKGSVACGLTSDFGRPVFITVLDPNLDISQDKHPCFGRETSAYEVTDRIALHEVGHFYALAEQYNTTNASVLYSDSGRINRKSVMGASFSKQLSCDDVDGFIKLADRTFYKIRGKYNARDEKGWASFCKDGTVYKKGKVLNRKPYFAHGNLYLYDAEGNIAQTVSKSPFIFDADTKIALVPGTGLVEKSIDLSHDLLMKYIYDLSAAHPSVETKVYTLKSGLLLESSKYEKDVAGNYWKFYPYKLFVTGNDCRFEQEGSTLVNIYADKKGRNFWWEFSYPGYGESLTHVKKYDFKNGNYKCEFTSKKPDGTVRYQYAFEYRKDRKSLESVRVPTDITVNEQGLKTIKELCMAEPTYFQGMKESAFAPACEFFAEIDGSIPKK